MRASPTCRLNRCHCAGVGQAASVGRVREREPRAAATGLPASADPRAPSKAMTAETERRNDRRERVRLVTRGCLVGSRGTMANAELTGAPYLRVRVERRVMNT